MLLANVVIGLVVFTTFALVGLFFIQLIYIVDLKRLLFTLNAVKNTNPVNWMEVSEETFVNPVGEEMKVIHKAVIPYKGKCVAIRIYPTKKECVKIFIREGWRKKDAMVPSSFDTYSVESLHTILNKFISKRICKLVEKKAQFLIDAESL